MAFEPIIDISTIDLTCIVAISEEEVGKINPQAGDMRQLNHVAWLSEDNQSAVGMRYVKVKDDVLGRWAHSRKANLSRRSND